MFNLFEFIFFAFQFPGLPKQVFILTGLAHPYKPNKAQAQVIPVSPMAQPLWTWPVLTCSSLSMPGHGLGMQAGASPLKFAWQPGWKSE